MVQLHVVAVVYALPFGPPEIDSKYLAQFEILKTYIFVEKAILLCTRKGEKMYLFIIPHHTPPYFKINLQNNHTSGD